MARFNNGLVFTNDNCISCNKCINLCSVFGANVSVIKDGKYYTQIDSRRCINCGQCISMCVHNAREYKDDSERFYTALKSGEKLSVIIAPSFYVLYKDNAEHILGYLKHLGVDKIYNGSFGTEISIWAHVNYLKNPVLSAAGHQAFISNSCPAAVNMIEQYSPFLSRRIIPVQSPAMCAAIYVKKYLGDNNKLAYIGPCIAKKDEFSKENNRNAVAYNLTFQHLMEKIPEVETGIYSAQADVQSIGSDNSFPVNGTFLETVSMFFPKTETINRLSGLKTENLDRLSISLNNKYYSSQPLFTEFISCPDGCIQGPGIDRTHFDSGYVYSTLTQLRRSSYEDFEVSSDPDEMWNLFNQKFLELKLDVADFACHFSDRAQQQFHIPENAYEEIFSDMLKDSPEKQKINCGYCGYSSSREMVKAIAHGFNKKENCIHYMNDEMAKRLFTDYETGLLSRSAIIKDCEAWKKKNPDKQLLIAVGEINKLKIINDLYGFKSGSAVLKLVASELKELAGPEGFCARQDSRTFILCMENTIENNTRLRNCKLFDCSSAGIRFPVTMSFGLYVSGPGEQINEGINSASLCVDLNNNGVQNYFTIFSQEFKRKTFEEANITAQMQKALDNKEFVLWFQPQYSTETGELTGAEALCRWMRTEDDMISPAMFIPIAEKNGFIRMLDKEIWRMAFATVKRWLDEGIEPVPVSVNISRVSLESDAILYVILHLKNEFKVPEKYIHFEVTETASVSNQQELIERIGKIREMGYEIAMDDFGTGYSSLNALKDFPIDILKLDMGFFRGEKNKDKGGTIISCLTEMAQNLNLVTIAEGVETQTQADFLKSIGVNIIQGYLYSKPLPEVLFYDLLTKTSRKRFVEKPVQNGNLDVHGFFDASSSESIMFEHFVGAAIIYQYDEKTKKLSVSRINDKALHLTGLEGYSLAQAKKLYTKHLDKTDIQNFRSSLLKAMENGDEQNCLISFYYEGRNKISLKCHIKEISITSPLHFIYVSLEDQTESTESKTALASANLQMQLIMDNSQVGMMLMHLETAFPVTVETTKITVERVNSSFAKVSGYSEQEILKWTQKDMLNVIHPEDRVKFLFSSIKSLVNRYKKPFTFDYRAKMKDGNYRKVRIFVTGIQHSDKSFTIISNYVPLD